MEFFHSLTLDLKLLAAGIMGCALLALFSGSRNAEKRYLLVLVVLSVAGAYRYTHLPDRDKGGLAAAEPVHYEKMPDKHVPLVSTSSK